MTECLTEDMLNDFQAGCASPSQVESIARHLSHCESCAARLAAREAHHERLYRHLRAGMRVARDNPAPSPGRDDPPATPIPSDAAGSAATVAAPPSGSAPTGDSNSGGLSRDAIAGYEIVHEISRGGQGIVYLAMQKATRRKVAIKVMRDGVFSGSRDKARFEREAQILAQLRHPNIVTVHDSGIAAGHHYFVMDYISGKPLDEYAAEMSARGGDASIGKSGTAERRLSTTLQLFSRICDAVRAAHQRGIVHRDLKPGNIRVDAGGEPHILDFGLARTLGGAGADESNLGLMTVTGQFMGSLPWASPEQAEAIPSLIDTRTDVYSLGVILFQLLTGAFPYEVTGQRRDVVNNIIHVDPARPSTIRREIDDEVETVILKCLQKDRDRRYQSAAELGRDIDRYIAGEPIEAKRDSAIYMLRKSLRRHRARLTVAAGMMVILTIALGVIWRERRAHVHELERAYAHGVTAAAEQAAARAGAAVTNAPAPPPDPALVDRAASVRVNLSGEVSALNPLLAHSLGEVVACSLLYESLFVHTSDEECAINSHLVSAIEETPDPLVKIVYLRPDARWHDGRPVTSADIVFSWRQVNNRSLGSGRYREAARIASVTAPNPRTVHVTLTEPHVTWRLSAGFEILPEHAFESWTDADGDTLLARHHSFGQSPIGSGPYEFVSLDSNLLVLKRSVYYGDGAPHIARFELTWTRAPADMTADFASRSLDLCELRESAYRNDRFSDAFRAAGHAELFPEATFYYILWNCAAADGLFADARVRRAMAHAVDHQRINAQVLNNIPAAPCYGPWDMSPRYFDPTDTRFRYDRQLAARLLDLAGWRAAADGTRQRTNSKGQTQPLAFSLMVQAGGERSLGIARVLGDDLAALGVKLDIREVQWGDAWTHAKNSGDFDALLDATIPPTDPEQWARRFATRDSETGEGLENVSGYSNREVDMGFRRAASEHDANVRARILRDLHKTLYDDQPMCFLFHRPAMWAVSTRLRGIEFSPRGPFLFYPGVLGWWVSAAGHHDEDRGKRD